MTTDDKKLRGFAHMQKHNPERFAELTRKGGASVASENRSFSRNRDLAANAGRKGGSSSTKQTQVA
jgi:general stress protein YciG